MCTRLAGLRIGLRWWYAAEGWANASAKILRLFGGMWTHTRTRCAPVTPFDMHDAIKVFDANERNETRRKTAYKESNLPMASSCYLFECVYLSLVRWTTLLLCAQQQWLSGFDVVLFSFVLVSATGICGMELSRPMMCEFRFGIHRRANLINKLQIHSSQLRDCNAHYMLAIFFLSLNTVQRMLAIQIRTHGRMRFCQLPNHTLCINTSFDSVWHYWNGNQRYIERLAGLRRNIIPWTLDWL